MSLKSDNLQRYSFDVDYEERVVSIKDDKGSYVLAIDAEEDIAKLKRELWIAREKRAMATMEFITERCKWFKDYIKVEPPTKLVCLIKKWANVERLCLAKSQELKNAED